jgi:type IV pilus assembly protein PilA
MINQLRRRQRDERGFTLTELMVVVLIIGILLVIAVPTFLGARTRAQDSAAQSNLRSTQSAAAVVYTDNESYKDSNAKALKAAEASVNYVNSPKASADPDTVSVSAGTDFGAAAKSKAGSCFYTYSQNSGKTLYGSSDKAKCSGDQAKKYAKSSDY